MKKEEKLALINQVIARGSISYSCNRLFLISTNNENADDISKVLEDVPGFMETNFPEYAPIILKRMKELLKKYKYDPELDNDDILDIFIFGIEESIGSIKRLLASSGFDAFDAVMSSDEINTVRIECLELLIKEVEKLDE